MPQIASILIWAIDIFRIVLLARIILDWVRAMNPSFRPKGIFLILAELAYTLTDWVIKPISKVIKPIRVGGGYIDLSIIAVLVLLMILDYLLRILL
ncbi:MAG: YggT family protein [Rhodoluna sp.]